MANSNPFDFEYETIQVRKDLIPSGGTLVEAYETEKEIIVIGMPPPEPDEHDDSWYETGHQCDQMGCGTLSHVIYRFDKESSYGGQLHAAQSSEREAMITALKDLLALRPTDDEGRCLDCGVMTVGFSKKQHKEFCKVEKARKLTEPTPAKVGEGGEQT